MLKVTLKKSLIGSLPNQKATAASLGLQGHWTSCSRGEGVSPPKKQ